MIRSQNRPTVAGESTDIVLLSFVISTQKTFDANLDCVDLLGSTKYKKVKSIKPFDFQ